MDTLIISGGRFDKEFAASWLKTNVYDYVIAVDYGLRYAKELGITPNLIVGDFDSNGESIFKEYIYKTFKKQFKIILKYS